MDDRQRRFEALALPHLDAAYNLARWLTRSAADADDVLQDAVLRALRGFESFRGADAKPWLLAIVRNCYLTAVKRRRSHIPLGETGDGAALEVPSADPNPEEHAMRATERRKLDDVLADLPEDYREILILREMEDLSYRDIAVVIGVPIGTVMSRLARARAALRDKWLAEERTS